MEPLHKAVYIYNLVMSSDEDKYLAELGKSLKNLRQTLTKKSLRLLAYEAGIPHSTLSRLERGERMASIITLKRLSFAFNMNIGQFINKLEENIPEKIKNFDV